MRENARAGRVGNGEGIDQVTGAVEKGVERNIVKHAVRHHHQMFALQMRAQWRQHFPVELTEVRLRGCEQWFLKRTNILSAETKLRNLKVQHANQVRHAGYRCERYDFQTIARDDGGDEPVLHGEVLNQSRVRWQGFLNGIE